MPASNDLSISQWLQQWHKIINKSKQEGSQSFSLATFICWLIWLARNDAHFQRRCWTLTQVINRAVSASLKFASIWFPFAPSLTNSTETSLDDNRNLYASSTIMMSTDASICPDASTRGLGFCCKSLNGHICKEVSSSWSFEGSFEGEALAVRLAMTDAISEGWNNVLFQSDCKQLINILNGDGKDCPRNFLSIVGDILSLRSSFQVRKFSFTQMVHNRIAHALARKALTEEGLVEWSVSEAWV